MNNQSKYYNELIDVQCKVPHLTKESIFMIMRDIVDKAEQDGQSEISSLKEHIDNLENQLIETQEMMDY